MKNPLHYIHKYPLRTKQILGISYEQFLLLVKGLRQVMEQKTGIRNRTIFLSPQPCIYIYGYYALPCIYIDKRRKAVKTLYAKNFIRFSTQVADTVLVL
ncbi:hypothetical protein Chro_3735 [Chroococcidiopsis thermalis PCC 7203]|uniref:Uncharacterized protein n=1 Tax=Chroococcidiopsis thermalis (strain PCC 7203) TaxID=251229 RepID=K9U406_CHRTP|nr:hypothetical protein Chro_3735 [Chroococcidiopsis thermalis PCC 7203]